MAFLRYARATVVQPHVSDRRWGQVRTAAKHKTNEDLVRRASEILGEQFDPDKYLLTHATIVCSVDVMPVDAPLGKVANDHGQSITRKWADFRITPETDQFINNNFDSWSRAVLLKTYPSFIGGHNFCFAPGVQVLMADGTYHPIDQVKVGDEVVTHKGRVRRVTHVFERGYEGQLLEVYVDRFNRPILATDNHPFRVIDVDTPQLRAYRGSDPVSQARYRRDQIVKALRGDQSVFDAVPALLKVVEILQAEGPLTQRELADRGIPFSSLLKILKRETCFFQCRPMTQEEALLRKPRTRRAKVWHLLADAPLHLVRPFSASKDWKPAGDLEAGQFLLGPERRCGQVSAKDEATLLGYYMAEGCLLGTPEKPTGFCLSFGPHERGLAEHAQQIARKLFPRPSSNINPTQTTLRLDVHGPEAGEWAWRMGGHLAHKKRLHPSVFSWDQKSLLHLLGAWMAGDGNLHEATFRLRGTSVSETLARQMHRVAEIAGVKTFVVFERRNIGEVSSQVVLTIGGEPKSFDVIPRHHAWTVVVSKDSVHEVTTHSQRWPSLCRVHASRLKRDNLAWWGNCRVHKVSDLRSSPYSGKVYNLEVEEDHSYVVDHGVAVHNCEHVQIEEQSKGRIIDAVARDIGPSVYVDILIATDRKHAVLVKDIEEGRMSTLSMGCSVSSTTCTKCGNVAADETEFCNCIKYEKGNYFFDEKGVRHRVAELCGHQDIESPPGGVTFIEASWVATPAFPGAVMRNILTPSETTAAIAAKAAHVLNTPPAKWVKGKKKKAAMDHVADELDFGEPDEDAPKEDDKKKDDLKGLEDEMYQVMLNRVKTRWKKEQEGPEPSLAEVSHSTGDNLIKQGNHAKTSQTDSYRKKVASLVRTAGSEVELLDKLARLNASLNLEIPRELYLTANKLGSISKYRTHNEYLAISRRVLDRQISNGEANTLIRLGRLLASWNERPSKPQK